MDRRASLPAGAELLHPAAGPRGAAARDLYRLADASHEGRPAGRPAVRAARAGLHHGAQLDLCAAGQGQSRAGPVLRPEGRRAGDRGRGGAAGRQAGAPEQRHARHRGGGLRRDLLLRRAVPDHHHRHRAARLAGRMAGMAAVPERRRPRQGRRQAGRGCRLPAGRGDARACQAQSALVADHQLDFPGAVAGADRGAVRLAGRPERVHPDRRVLQQDGGGQLRRRLCAAGLRGAAGGRQLSLGDGGRDAGRPRHGRDDARSADHGDAVRGLPRRLALARSAQPDRCRHPGRSAHHLGHLRAVLSLDLLRRAVRRGAARQ